MTQMPGDPSGRSRVRPLPHPLTPYSELIVNFCPTGMIPTKAMTPHVPISPAEVVEQACRALERGVAIVHLHARERDGTPTYRASEVLELTGPARLMGLAPSLAHPAAPAQAASGT